MPEQSRDKTFAWPVRVYYEDTDAQGLVYYANYFRFMERARTEWLRALGVEQDVLMREERRLFVVVDTHAEFIKPARFNDELLVTCGLIGHARASFDLRQEVLSTTGDVLVRGRTRAAYLNADSLKPARLPPRSFRRKPPMTTDMSFISLVMNASIAVQIVMLLLLIASLLSWSIIFTKRRLIRRTKAASDDFEANFWSGGDLQTLYQSTARRKDKNVGMASIFEAGFREFTRASQQGDVEPAKMIEECQRAMRVAQMREVDRLEQSLATLATIGSTSPYVGLFGTVIGIMNSFRALAGVQTATLAMVAPGIAEALVATAMGLFAAIPAVVAYNRYADKVIRLETRYDGFMEEFISILQRHARARKGA
ncbi:MAG: protein TolQ [Woeseiaceae bacterium]|nr:protein TolQ [Woeseiaceae bacterium]